MPAPSRRVLAVFALSTIAGGANVLAVRFSDRDLAPFWGAGARFAASAVLVLAVAIVARLSLPRGRALAGALAYGALQFGVGFGLLYRGLEDAPAAFGSTMLALSPLLTFVVAVLAGMETFRWRGVAAALVSIAGVAVVFADELRAVPVTAVLVLCGVPLAAAFATVLAKGLPRPHPIATNVAAFPAGALVLFAISALQRETPALPAHADVWIAFLYLVVGTPAYFVGFFYVVRHWTASATSYSLAILPVVTVALGAALAGETVSAPFVVGSALVMAGAYLGVSSSEVGVAAGAIES